MFSENALSLSLSESAAALSDSALRTCSLEVLSERALRLTLSVLSERALRTSENAL